MRYPLSCFATKSSRNEGVVGRVPYQSTVWYGIVQDFFCTDCPTTIDRSVWYVYTVAKNQKRTTPYQKWAVRQESFCGSDCDCAMRERCRIKREGEFVLLFPSILFLQSILFFVLWKLLPVPVSIMLSSLTQRQLQQRQLQQRHNYDSRRCNHHRHHDHCDNHLP